MTSHEVIVETIAATTTSTGLTVTPNSTPSTYPTGIKITDQQMRDLEPTDGGHEKLPVGGHESAH